MCICTAFGVDLEVKIGESRGGGATKAPTTLMTSHVLQGQFQQWLIPKF